MSLVPSSAWLGYSWKFSDACHPCSCVKAPHRASIPNLENQAFFLTHNTDCVTEGSYINAGKNCADLGGLGGGPGLLLWSQTFFSRRQFPTCIIFGISKDPQNRVELAGEEGHQTWETQLWVHQMCFPRTCLAVQCLRLRASTAGVAGLIPWSGS